jgi:hypothetical protein
MPTTRQRLRTASVACYRYKTISGVYDLTLAQGPRGVLFAWTGFNDKLPRGGPFCMWLPDPEDPPEIGVLASNLWLVREDHASSLHAFLLAELPKLGTQSGDPRDLSNEGLPPTLEDPTTEEGCAWCHGRPPCARCGT